MSMYTPWFINTFRWSLESSFSNALNLSRIRFVTSPVEYPVCFSIESIMPGLPLITAYVSSELSVTLISATSERRIVSIPSIPISTSGRSFNSLTSCTASPTRTRYSVSPSMAYPAGISKFCAASRLVMVSLLSTLFRSAESCAVSLASSSLLCALSKEEAALASSVEEALTWSAVMDALAFNVSKAEARLTFPLSTFCCARSMVFIPVLTLVRSFPTSADAAGRSS